MARGILLTVLCAFATLEIINVLTAPAPPHGFALAGGICSVFVAFILQLFNSSPAAERWPLWRRLAVLVAQGLATYLPLALLGDEWGGMAGFFAGSLLLLLPGRFAWTLFGAAVLSMLIDPIRSGLSVSETAYVVLATLDTGLMVFGLSRLSLIVDYLHAARADLAQLAVIRERVRFARDLHDLLGYSLSAITLKAELTRRLVETDPARARDELAELLDIARQSLADVRLVASGYRNMSLAKEAASVSSLLATAGISAHVTVDCGGLDEKVDTVLATVLREAVTNVLRHSSAQNCAVEATEHEQMVRLRVSNDGVPTAAVNRRGGGGLENLALRVESVGGTLSASVRHDGWFEVLATVAAVPPPARDGGAADAAGGAGGAAGADAGSGGAPDPGEPPGKSM